MRSDGLDESTGSEPTPGIPGRRERMRMMTQTLAPGTILWGNSPRARINGTVWIPSSLISGVWTAPADLTMETYPGTYPFQPQETVVIPAGTRFRFESGDARTRSMVEILETR